MCNKDKKMCVCVCVCGCECVCVLPEAQQRREVQPSSSSYYKTTNYAATARKLLCWGLINRTQTLRKKKPSRARIQSLRKTSRKICIWSLSHLSALRKAEISADLQESKLKTQQKEQKHQHRALQSDSSGSESFILKEETRWGRLLLPADASFHSGRLRSEKKKKKRKMREVWLRTMLLL